MVTSPHEKKLLQDFSAFPKLLLFIFSSIIVILSIFCREMSYEDIFHELTNNFLKVFSKSYSREKFVTIWPGDIGGRGGQPNW